MAAYQVLAFSTKDDFDRIIQYPRWKVTWWGASPSAYTSIRDVNRLRLSLEQAQEGLKAARANYPCLLYAILKVDDAEPVS